MPNGIVPGTEIELPLPNFTGTYKGNGYVISGQNAFSGGSPLITPDPEPEPEEFQYLSPEEFFGYYKKGGILKASDGLSTLFARPDGKDNKYLKQSEGLGKGHFINTLGRIYQQERLGTQFGDQYADALGKRTVHTPNIKINNRFNDFRSDEADRTGSKYLTQINQFKTADSGLNAATRMAGEDQ